MPQADTFAGDLNRIFRQYNAEKTVLQRLYCRTGQTFHEVKEKLEKDIEDVQFREKLDNFIMYPNTLHKVDRVINQDPSIICIGQTKSGKSSLINEILGATVVAVDQRPCTARLVQLEYAYGEPQVMIVDKTGKVTEQKKLTNKYIPSKWINLPQNQRQKEEIVTQRVVAQVKNPFLESGVRIIDSPGKDENPLLDKLVMDHLGSILPLIVYVIDGRNLVTVKDLEDIKSITGISPAKNIFYVVSKLDSNERPSSSSSDDESPDEEELARWEERLKRQERKVMQVVYNKLCKEGILDKNVKMDDCPQFHGLSAWKIKDHRRGSKTKQLPQNRFTEAFTKFKEQLVIFSKLQLNYFVETAADALAKIHQGCINFFIDEANRIYNSNSNYDEFIYNVREKEAQLVEKLNEKIDTECVDVKTSIEDFLNGIKSKVVSEARYYEYKEAMKKPSKETMAKASNSTEMPPEKHRAGSIKNKPSRQARRKNSLYIYEELAPLLPTEHDDRDKLDWLKVEEDCECEDATDKCEMQEDSLSPIAPISNHRDDSFQFRKQASQSTSARSSAEIDPDSYLEEEHIIEAPAGWDFLQTVRGNDFVTDMRVVVECENQIRRFIRERVGLGLSNMIWDEMIRQGGVLDVLSQTATGFDIPGASDDPATVLRNLIHEHYQYRYSPEIEKMEMNFKRRIRAGVKHFLMSLTDMPQHPSGVGNIPVNQDEWKEQIAKDAYSAITAKRVTEEIISHLKIHVKEGHDQFRQQHEMVYYLYQKQCQIGKRNRDTIRNCAPKIAELEVRSLDLINTHYFYDFETLQYLGQGSQATVHMIDKTGPNGEPLVVKKRRVQKIDELQAIALEVHHTRNVDHPNLTKLYGCVIRYIYRPNHQTEAEMCLFYKYVNGDVLNMIAGGHFPNLRDRLEMALQVAQAVKYLHGKDITHRDIKGENVLMDIATRHITLTDFGHMKPYGMTAQTICGTPGFMAPEFHTQGADLKCPAIDIYAFGIFFWFIVDGTSDNPFADKHYFQIWEETCQGIRPPIKDSFDWDCVALMSDCWQHDPKDRPVISEVVARLKKILEKFRISLTF